MVSGGFVVFVRYFGLRDRFAQLVYDICFACWGPVIRNLWGKQDSTHLRALLHKNTFPTSTCAGHQTI